jgi:tripartite-type tricarboxylate transporter receptor subunit TctC
MTSATSDIKSLEDLITISRSRDVTIGHGGITSQAYKAAEVLCGKLLSNRCLLVPFKSGPEGMLGLATNTVDIFPQVSYGNESYIRNSRYHPVVFLSRIKHNLFPNIPTLPEKYKHIEQNNWVILFGKNLSDRDKNTIINVYKSQPPSFYTDLGYRYSFMEPKKVMQND